ncbi:MAG: response regulator [Termitinemataceae bacterium]|nr:MAG: response regulator [Termitinemataceae bacterium]
MNLTYSILWFEDEPDFVESLKDELKEFVEAMGFNFNIPKVETDNSQVDSIECGNYDLILMDYNLSSVEKGDAIIEKIRTLEVYTTVIFYSSSPIPTLRKAIQDRGIDGVFCVGRGHDSFVPRVQSIIQTTVRKVLDLNNVRGLVMAEASDFDDKMKEIINLFISQQSEAVSNDFLAERRIKLIKSLNDKIGKIDRLELNQIHNDISFDADHKWRAIQKIVKSIGNAEIIECVKQYENDIIKKRNPLAHLKEQHSADGRICLSDNRGFVFNDAARKQIMTDLKKHAKNFDIIIGKLKDAKNTGLSRWSK